MIDQRKLALVSVRAQPRVVWELSGARKSDKLGSTTKLKPRLYMSLMLLATLITSYLIPNMAEQPKERVC